MSSVHNMKWPCRYKWCYSLDDNNKEYARGPCIGCIMIKFLELLGAYK
jgi:hypothetical protein